MVQEEVLETIEDAALEVFAVWMPVLRSDDLAAGQKASSELLVDPRVHHYWDADLALGSAYASVLGLEHGTMAWDAYLLYGRDASWSVDVRAPPEPDDWMHQLRGETSSRYLDGKKLAARVRRELETKTPAGEPSLPGTRGEPPAR